MEDQIRQILKGLGKRIQCVVVVDKAGLPITSFDTETKQRVNPSMETVVAGIGAAVLSLAESTSSVINQGNLKELIIKNESGTIIILNAGENALLIGILPTHTGYDTPLISLKTAASQIKKIKIPSSQPALKPEATSEIFIPKID